mgnify:CR=1 FL=1
MPKITEAQRKKAIREYFRKYRKNNPEKIKKIRDRYWNNVFRKMKEKSISIDTSAIRQKLGLNQQQFWARLGVTQSGGSRYENGRRIPRPVQQLVHLMYVENIDIQKIKREDFEVIEYLRANKPAFLKELKKEAKAAAAAAKKGG